MLAMSRCVPWSRSSSRFPTDVAVDTSLDFLLVQACRSRAMTDFGVAEYSATWTTDPIRRIAPAVDQGEDDEVNASNATIDGRIVDALSCKISLVVSCRSTQGIHGRHDWAIASVRSLGDSFSHSRNQVAFTAWKKQMVGRHRGTAVSRSHRAALDCCLRAMAACGAIGLRPVALGQASRHPAPAVDQHEE